MDLAITQESGGISFTTSDNGLKLLLSGFSVRLEFEKTLVIQSKNNDVRRQIEINFDIFDSITFDGITVTTIDELYDIFKNISSGGTQDVNVTNDPLQAKLGLYDTNTGAWGAPKTIQDYSIDRGLFTFGIEFKYSRFKDDIEELNGVLDDKIYSERGKLVVTTDVSEKVTLRTQRYYQYQPNRGQIYSDSEWLPNAGNGKLYFVTRKKLTDTVSEDRVEITNLPDDISKGNVYDIQFQWRGAGNYEFFTNLEKVATKVNLGLTTELTITNPSLPVAFEAQKGAHTYGGVSRSGSAVRWGLFGKENGIYYEWEYEDTRDPHIECGCWDVSSEGGTIPPATYTSVVALNKASDSGEQPAVVVRIPKTKIVRGGHTWDFTRSVQFSRLIGGQTDESRIRVYYTRDETAIVDTGTIGWQSDIVTDTLQYLINNDADANESFTFDETKAIVVFGTRQEQDQPDQFTDPLKPNGNISLNPGDYLIITRESAGTDTKDTTLEFGVEF